MIWRGIVVAIVTLSSAGCATSPMARTEHRSPPLAAARHAAPLVERPSAPPLSSTCTHRAFDTGFYSAHSDTSCVVDAECALACASSNTEAQLGDGPRNELLRRVGTTRITGLPPVRAVRVLPTRVCAIDTEDRSWCWGCPSPGTVHCVERPAPVQVPEPVIDIAGTTHTACALGRSGRLYCFGRLGYPFSWEHERAGPPPPEDVQLGLDAPLAVAAQRRFRAVVANEWIWCAVDDAEHAHCWTDITPDGQLAGGELGLDGVLSIVALHAHFCAIHGVERRVACWHAGDVYASASRRGPWGGVLRARAIDFGLRGVAALVGDTEHACAVLDGGEVTCWIDGYELRPPIVEARAPFFRDGYPRPDRELLPHRVVSEGAARALVEGRVTCVGDRTSWRCAGGAELAALRRAWPELGVLTEPPSR